MIKEVFSELSICLFFAGIFGALIADLIKDNCIILPKKIGDLVNLGSVGAWLIGGVAGLIIDGSLLTAFMGGYIGKDIIVKILAGNFSKQVKIKTADSSSAE